MPEDSVVTQKQVAMCMEEDGTMVMSSVDVKDEGDMTLVEKAANKLRVEKTKITVKNLELNFYYLMKEQCRKKATQYKMEWMPGLGGGLVHLFKSLKIIWDEQFSMEMAEEMWQVLFGQFEEESDWQNLVDDAVEKTNLRLGSEEIRQWVERVGQRQLNKIRSFVSEAHLTEHGCTLRLGEVDGTPPRRKGEYSTKACLVLAESFNSKKYDEYKRELGVLPAEGKKKKKRRKTH